MTVYLKGKDGRCDQIEKNVKTVKADKKYIEIRYNHYEYGCVVGVTYYADEMEIEKIEA